MGMIRVSDDAEKKLKALAEGRTVVAVVDELLAHNDLATRFDKQAVFMAEMKKDIIASIENTTIDRIATPVGRRAPSSRIIDVDWPIFQELWLDHIDDRNNPAWTSKAAYDGLSNSDDASSCTYYIKGDQLWYNFMGVNDQPLLNLTPEVTDFLTEKGVL